MGMQLPATAVSGGESLGLLSWFSGDTPRLPHTLLAANSVFSQKFSINYRSNQKNAPGKDGDT